MEKTKAMVTVNWRGKENKRGLTETAIETLRKTSLSANRPELTDEANKLHEEYEKLKELIHINGVRQSSLFSYDRELQLVKKYVRVRF